MFVRRKEVRSGNRTYTYVQLVQNHRVDGKPRQKVLLSLGREDQLDRSQVDQLMLALRDLTEKVEVLGSWEEVGLGPGLELGSAYVLGRLWEEAGLGEVLRCQMRGRNFETDLVAAVKAMVLNRCLDPQSKLATVEWLEGVYLPECRGLEVHHLYRALDLLCARKERIEEALYGRLTDLFSVDVSVVFYDTTLVTMHGETGGLVQYGRNGVPQFLLSLALSRDGLPIAHELFPGNTVDVSTVKAAMDQLSRRFGISRCILVGDRGTVSAENLEGLRQAGYDYIVGVRMRQGGQTHDRVLATPGRYAQIRENLFVKEAEVDGGRYLICYNPQEADHDREVRQAILAQLEDDLRDLRPGSRKAAELWSHPLKARFLRRLKDGSLRLDRARAAEEARYDGKYVLRTSRRDLEASEVALVYHQLLTVERSFRSLKSLQQIAPVFHYHDRRIRAHVFVCVLAHLLERLLENKLHATGMEITASRALRQLARLQLIPAAIGQKHWLVRTDVTPQAAAILAALRYRLPPKLQEVITPSPAPARGAKV